MQLRSILILLLVLFFLSGCFQANPENPFFPDAVTPELASTLVPSDLPPATATAPIYPWSDENTVMSGICFEAALAEANRVFVLRDAIDHIEFYGAMDETRTCRHPVTRNPFDFSTGRVLAGLWSTGSGCTARHDVTGIERDDVNRSLIIHLHFVTEGTCNYELVRPFWIGLDGITDYDIRLQLE